MKNGEFVVPEFIRIISSTTAAKVIDYIENEIVPKALLPASYINRVSRREISIEEAQKDASEVFFLGGEECVPVIEWDGKPVSTGQRGPAASLFQ